MIKGLIEKAERRCEDAQRRAFAQLEQDEVQKVGEVSAGWPPRRPGIARARAPLTVLLLPSSRSPRPCS